MNHIIKIFKVLIPLSFLSLATITVQATTLNENSNHHLNSGSSSLILNNSNARDIKNASVNSPSSDSLIVKMEQLMEALKREKEIQDSLLKKNNPNPKIGKSYNPFILLPQVREEIRQDWEEVDDSKCDISNFTVNLLISDPSAMKKEKSIKNNKKNEQKTRNLSEYKYKIKSSLGYDFKPIKKEDSYGNTLFFQSMCMDNQYEDFSSEEIRFKDFGINKYEWKRRQKYGKIIDLSRYSSKN